MDNPKSIKPVSKKTEKIFKIKKEVKKPISKPNSKIGSKQTSKQISKPGSSPVPKPVPKVIQKKVLKNQLVNLFTGAFFIFALLVLVILISMIQLQPEATCFDGILNQNEIEIDCGGVCLSCDYLDDAEPDVDDDSGQVVRGDSEQEPEQVIQNFSPMKVARIFSAKSSNPKIPIFFRVDPIINENEIMEGRNIGKMESNGEYVDRYFNEREPTVLILFIDSALEKVEAQKIEIETDAGNFTIYLPELAENGMYYMLYVSENGSTFYSKNNHLDGRLDMPVSQALTIVHAARLAP